MKKKPSISVFIFKNLSVAIVLQSKFETMKSQHLKRIKKQLAVNENNLTRPTVDLIYN